MEIPNPAADMAVVVTQIEVWLKRPFTPSMNILGWAGFVLIILLLTGFWAMVMKDLEA